MWPIPIDLECYAGFKPDETPLRLGPRAEWLNVVLDRWYEALRSNA